MIKFSIQQKRVWTYDSKFTFFFVRIQLELIVNNQRYTVQQNSSAFFWHKTDDWNHIRFISFSVSRLRTFIAYTIATFQENVLWLMTFASWKTCGRSDFEEMDTLAGDIQDNIYIYIYTYIFFLLCICIFSASARFRFRRNRLLPLSFFLYPYHQLNLSHELNSWWRKFRRSFRLILKSKVWIHICFDVTKSYSILSNSFLILKEKRIFTVSWISWFHATQIRIECIQ